MTLTPHPCRPTRFISVRRNSFPLLDLGHKRSQQLAREQRKTASKHAKSKRFLPPGDVLPLMHLPEPDSFRTARVPLP